jgi:hypothetical protein
VTDREVAAAAGVSTMTVVRDRQQIEAGERYPMLATRLAALAAGIHVPASSITSYFG